MFKIYAIINKVNGKIYVGKTSLTPQRRFTRHVRCAEKGFPWSICRAIRKYGCDAFQVREIDQADSEKLANQQEVLYIDLLRSNYPEFGYNLTAGGDGGSQNEEVRKRMSENNRGSKNPHFGKRHTPETRRAMSEGQKGSGGHFFGWKHREESKAKMAHFGSDNGFFGRTHSEKTRAKISEATKGRKAHNFGKYTEEILERHQRCHRQKQMISPSCRVCQNGLN